MWSAERGRGLGRAEGDDTLAREELLLDGQLVALARAAQPFVEHDRRQRQAMPVAGEADYPDLPLHGDRVSVNFLKEARVLPLAETEDGVAVVMADPLDRYTIGAMELFAGKPVRPWVGVPAEIEAALERLYGRGGALGDIVQAALEPGEHGSEDDVPAVRPADD